MSYFGPCIRAAIRSSGFQFRGVYWNNPAKRMIDLSVLEGLGEWTDRACLNESDIKGIVRSYKPQVILVSGWMDKGYLSVCQWARQQGIFVVGLSDTPLRIDYRQVVAVLLSRFFHKRWFDAMWVAGTRQANFARLLGFARPYLYEGVYCGDYERFEGASIPFNQRRREFVYVGRLEPAKAVDVLVEAYRAYRSQVSDPWNLTCIGDGSQRAIVEGIDGVHVTGYIQPSDLPAEMGSGSVFILPSREENWGVVIHEAASLGLPIICTECCGAADHLVRDGFNGYKVAVDNPEHLARAMRSISSMESGSLQVMGSNSSNLAAQYTPDAWAGTLKQIIDDHLGNETLIAINEQ